MSVIRRALRPDAQAFDEVHIVTAPRYKTSGMSGDEWRISARVDFMRKGVVCHTKTFRDVETACLFLAAERVRAIEDGKACFAEEGDYCDQEGCAEKATVTYRVKRTYCSEPYLHKPIEHDTEHEALYGIATRRFCARHARRGDCGFDDSDDNHELIEGVPKPRGSDESPSVFGGVISTDPGTDPSKDK